jgi:hypothetical protein
VCKEPAALEVNRSCQDSGVAPAMPLAVTQKLAMSWEMHYAVWKDKIREGGILSIASLIIVALGLIKLISAFGSSSILLLTDQLLGLQYKVIFLILGPFEVMAGLIALFWLSTSSKARLILFMALSFLVYRLYSLFSGSNQLCPCLGSAVEWLPWLSGHQNSAMASTAIWLLLVSSWSLYQQKRSFA